MISIIIDQSLFSTGRGVPPADSGENVRPIRLEQKEKTTRLKMSTDPAAWKDVAADLG